jgi:hypothetical protein
MHSQKNLITEERKVPCIALDTEYSFRDCQICFKIDVEGHESSVIAGAKDLLGKNKCFLQIEIYRGQEEGLKTLADLGYKQILKIGPDHYFTNLPWSDNDTVNLFQNVASAFIDVSKS